MYRAYPALVQTLQEIFSQEPDCIELVMAWKRRIKESSIFFDLMAEAGFQCHKYGRGLFSFYKSDRVDDYLQSLSSRAGDQKDDE